MKKNVLVFLWIALLIFGINGKQTYAQGWTKVFEESNGLYITGLWFVESNQWETGWLLSTSEVLKTTNGGGTWTTFSNGLEPGCNGICFVDENVGYISNGYGKVFKSTDGGQTWTSVYNNSSNNLDGIAFKDALHGVASGNQIIYTNNGGTTWNIATNSADCDNVSYAGGDTYYATSGYDSKILKSTNGGQSFTELTQVQEYIETSTFLDENHGLAAGGYQICNITSDGGQTWVPRVLGDGVDDIFSAGYYDTDTIYAAGDPEIFKSVDGGIIWSVDTLINGEHQSLFVTKTNVIYVANIINFSTMQVWKKVGALPLVSDFEADETSACINSSIQFTDLSYFDATSWSWTFEGGTPSTSNDQNPAVNYTSPGKYDVSLTIGRDGETASLTKADYIEIYNFPAAPEIPSGNTDICNGFDFDYSVPLDDNVQSYIWELSPVNAGNLIVNMNEVTLEADNSWTGNFSLKVKGLNVCGEGPWSDNLEGTLHANPTAFNLLGGGGFCENSAGVEISLDGSEIGVDYSLILDGVPTGNIVAGTGAPISFGMVNLSGYYEALGTSDYCEVLMQNQLLVTELNAPGQAGVPEGPETVCFLVSSDYTTTGAEFADSYEWTLMPVEAGTMAASGMEVTVSWNNNYSGMASLSLIGINDCGEGESSAVLEISVNYLASPEISGLDLVCDLQVESYSVVEHEGNTYTWEVAGGTLTSGQGSAEVILSWGDPGTGSIMVTEENVNGCMSISESFGVIIDNCTGLDEMGTRDKAQVFPNPASDKLNIITTTSADVYVYSLKGQLLLFKENISGSYQMDLSGLSNGTYIVKVIGDNQTSTNKISLLR